MRVIGLELDEASLADKPNFNLRGPAHMVVQFNEIRPGDLRRVTAEGAMWFNTKPDCTQSVMRDSLTAGRWIDV